ncbi:MAG: DUF58 domain-containing protein [Planctomycetota bacterium]|nr:DUF58 domain-containing protein [Planctomycetota bacterium]
MAGQGNRDFFDEEFLARLERLHLIAKRLAASGPGEAGRSRRLGDGLEFADHRDYAPGDDIRFIDWPYYARMEKLLLRMFHEHSEAGVVILLDRSGSMAPAGDLEKFRYTLRAAAALAYVAMANLRSVVLLPFAERLERSIRTGRNRGQIFEVLDFLAELNPAGPTNLLDCVKLCCQRRRRQERGGTVLLLSDLLDCGDGLRDSLTWLRAAGCQTLVLHLYCEADASPQLAGPMLLSQAETNQQMNLHVTEAVLESYRRRWAAFLADCERTCRSQSAVYVAASTAQPFERLILRTLRRAGVLTG